MKLLRNISLVLALSAITLACHKPQYISSRNAQFYKLNDTTTTDSTMLAIIAPYKQNMETQMEVVIGHADTNLTKAQPECTLGNLIADAQLAAARNIDTTTNAAVMNYGGIRRTVIEQGTITTREIFELLPFDNSLTIVEMRGDTLQLFCDHMAKLKGWPVSGLRFTIANEKAGNVLVNNKPLEKNRTYKIAVNDYLANGGDYCSFLTGLKKQATNIYIRDIVIDHVKERNASGKGVYATVEKRVSYE